MLRGQRETMSSWLWLPPKGLGAIPVGARTLSPVNCCSSDHVWSLPSYHRIQFFCKFVPSETAKCFLLFYLPLRPIPIGKVDSKPPNRNRYDVTSRSALQN